MGDQFDDGSMFIVQQNESKVRVLRPHALYDVDPLSCSGGEAEQLDKGWPLSCRGHLFRLLLMCM